MINRLRYRIAGPFCGRLGDCCGADSDLSRCDVDILCDVNIFGADFSDGCRILRKTLVFSLLNSWGGTRRRSKGRKQGLKMFRYIKSFRSHLNTRSGWIKDKFNTWILQLKLRSNLGT